MNETWFDEPIRAGRADVLRCVQRSEPMPTGTSTRFHTLVLDLQESPDRLLAKMKKETRYEIRRAAEKDRIRCHMWKATDAICRQEFRVLYDKFAADRGITPLNHQKMEKFAARGELILSLVRAEGGEPLVWHSYYRGDRRVRLLHSAVYTSEQDSTTRALLGRANRYLHWQDLLEFRSDGIHVYDFGGWYAGKDNKKVAINHFKEGFGGEIAVNYNCLCGLTSLGNATVWFYSRLGSHGTD